MNRTEIIEAAYDIAAEYDRQGLRLTLRQLYYQFVARGLLGSGQKVYKRIGAALVEARLDGRFPIDWIEDRGRSAGASDLECADDLDAAEDNARDLVGRSPWYLRYGRWYGQPVVPFVWVEKEALAGVLEPICTELGVGMFACKGYPSVSAVSAWVSETHEGLGDVGAEARIVYFGDHDPDGLEIPKSALDMVRKVQRVKGEWFPVDLDRVALTMAQIRRYNPPPFGAKVTSARYQRYVDETGTDDAWELDALEPTVLRQLVRDNVESFFDVDIRRQYAAEASELRRELVMRMRKPGWLDDALSRWL